jgi:hypothetical protein
VGDRPLAAADVAGFRIFLGAQSVSYFGSFVTYVAVPLQVARLTASPVAVGLLGLCELTPLLVTALIGGALADYTDRRRLVLLGELASMITCAVLLVNSLGAHPHLRVLYVAAALGAALDGLQRPAIEGLMQRVVPASQQAAAASLRALATDGAMLAGPAVGGLVIAEYGAPWAYGLELGTLALSLLALLLVRASPPPPDADRPSLASIAGGFRYAKRRPELIGTYVVDIVAMTFGMHGGAVFIVAPHLGGTAVLGPLYAAPSVGAVLATLTSGWTAG